MTDRLVAEGVLAPNLRDKAVAYQRKTQKRIEECLLELGAIRESELLRFLAARHKTRFVSTERLARADIDPGTLAKIPRKLAERYLAVPVLHDATNNVLSIATPDPDNVEAMDQILKGAGAREVRALVARPAAVEAAIRKFYYKDSLGFAVLEKTDGDSGFDLGGVLSTGGMEVSSAALIGLEVGALDAIASIETSSMSIGDVASPGSPSSQAKRLTAGSVGPPSTDIPSPPRVSAAQPASQSSPSSGLGSGSRLLKASSVRRAESPTARHDKVPPAQVAPAPKPPCAPSPAPRGANLPPPPPTTGRGVNVPPAQNPARGAIAPSPPACAPRGAHAPSPAPSNVARGVKTPPPAPAVGRPAPPHPASAKPKAEEPSSVFVTDQETTAKVFLETLHVLISVVENARAELRGHSAEVARLVRKMAERIGLAAPDVHALVAAAYLHDLGKAGSFHLTLLNAAEYDDPRAAAQKAYTNPTRLFQKVKLAPLTVAALQGMYERFDGTGLPDRKLGKEIPLAARLLAIVDTFVDLTTNPKNPLRHLLKPVEACEVLARYKGAVFDPALVDLLHTTVAGDDVRARILADRPVALLVDREPEDSIVLELQLAEQGFEVRVARTAEQALRLLELGDVDLVVAELDLGTSGEDGLSLLATARRTEWGRSLPWLVLSRREGRADAEAALALGVVDYVLKPAPAEVLVAKLKQALDNRASERAQRGVSGSISEMGIPDLVQVLFFGRKSGVLRLRHASVAGDIFFAAGMVVDATYGSVRGEDAFYRLMHLRDGDFAFDPAGRAEKTTITTSPEALLLEGMRRIDEQ